MPEEDYVANQRKLPKIPYKVLDAPQLQDDFYLNVLDESYDLSFLPEHLDGIAYCVGAINLKPFARIKLEDFIEDYKLQVLVLLKQSSNVYQN